MADETARRRPSRALVALIDEVRWYAVQADAHAVPPRDLAFVALGCDLAELAASWRSAADEVEAKALARAVAEDDVATISRRQVGLAGEVDQWQRRVRGWAQLVSGGPELASRIAELRRVPRMRYVTIGGAEDTLRASLPRLAAAVALAPAFDGPALVTAGDALLAAMNEALEAKVGFEAEVRALPSAEDGRSRLEWMGAQARRLWAQAARNGAGEVLPLTPRRPLARRRRRGARAVEGADAMVGPSSPQGACAVAPVMPTLPQADLAMPQANARLPQDHAAAPQQGFTSPQADLGFPQDRLTSPQAELAEPQVRSTSSK